MYGLGERDLISSHEARAAQNAQMILDEGHWLVPRLFDQHLELQKPPLYYWLVSLIAWLRGGLMDAWAVRLPAALSAWATVLFLYFLGVRTGRPRAGLIAALVLASCLHFTWLARVGRIDMPLTMTVTFALGAFHLGNRMDLSCKERFFWLAFGYTALGAGLLLKGPIAVALTFTCIAAIWLGCEHWSWHALGQRLRTSSLWWGVPWMIAIAAPWYLWANERTNNQLWEVFFWYHNVERGLGGADSLRAHPWWFYLPQMVLDLLPWSLVFPLAIYGWWRDEEIRREEAAKQGLFWFGAMLLFLSLMRFKRADYLLPAYPGMALFLGVSADRWWQKQICSVPRSPWINLARSSFFFLLGAYGAGWLIYHTHFLAAQENDWPYRKIAQEIRRQTPGPVIFFRAESHVLAYHVGQPLATILEWENLDIWTKQPGAIYVVMPAACAHEWQQYLPAGALEEVLRTEDYVQGPRARPLVVLRKRGQTASVP